MLKPTVVPLIALSLALAAPACEEPPDEPSPGEEEPAPEDTMAVPTDSIVETIGGDWIVRAKSGKACVSVPPSAIPQGETLDVHIKLVTPPPVFPGVEIVPPVYDFSVTDANEEPAQFADSVLFAICVNYAGPAPEGAGLVRRVSADSVELLPSAMVPRECRLTCPTPAPSTTAAWLDHLFGGSPVTPTPAHAAEGLGGKGRGTSPFAGLAP